MTRPREARREPAGAVTGVFAAEAEAGGDLAAVDWASTPLGPPGQWPQSLRTAVSILQARWHTALVDSLQEAFFVCDEDGAVVEINTAFTDILGYGPEELPYRPVHPWWRTP